MSDNIAIKVDNVSKTFRLPHEKTTSIKSAVVNFYRRNKTYEKQQVLKDVSFEINKGEFFGIVGRNGSGKSTLLKLLAGIYTSEKGSITVNGNLTPFIELGVGFNPELTGRENVFLNGALLGFNRKEMIGMYDDIVDFAEIERFMDQKLKNYSSGMQVRLAFSIAIRAKSDILLIDEVLAVGDENFQKKCIATFRQIKNRGTTIVFVSHDMTIVEQFCDRAILIDKGRLVFSGKSTKIASQYRDLNLETERKKSSSTTGNKKQSDEGLGAIKIRTRLLNKKGVEIDTVQENEPIVIESTLRATETIADALYSFTFENSEGLTVCQFSSEEVDIPLFSMEKGEQKVIVTSVQNVLPEGTYVIDPDVSTVGREVVYGHVDDACHFDVRAHTAHPWLLRPKYEMTQVSDTDKI